MKKPLIKILVLGASGMLGSLVQNYLTKNKAFSVVSSFRKLETKNNQCVLLDAEKVTLESELDFINDYDFVINCIGIIKPYCKDNDPTGVQKAIKVNALFPHLLANAATTAKIIQIATDCVYSGSKGKYLEDDLHDALDVYGKTKSLGEIFYAPNFLNIRCSIIGPENKNKLSLLEWFLAQPKNSELTGFTHHNWNGITTLQFAQLIEQIIVEANFDTLRKINHTLHYLPNETVTKAKLLEIMSQAYKLPVKIKSVDNIGQPVNRTLNTKFDQAFKLTKLKSMQAALNELASYNFN